MKVHPFFMSQTWFLSAGVYRLGLLLGAVVSLWALPGAALAQTFAAPGGSAAGAASAPAPQPPVLLLLQNKFVPQGRTWWPKGPSDPA